MKKRLWQLILLLGLFLFTITACGISFDGNDDKSSQEDIEIQLTVVSLQRTQTAVAAPPENSQKQPEDAQPDQDSDSDDSSDDDSGDDSDGSACNSSKFVSETIPDGTVYQAGDTFTKSWTLRNAGDCDWTTDYKFVFEGGDQMNGLTSMNLPSVIKPGKTITLELDLTAPSTAGDYVGVWRLKAADGEKLGKYWVKITVGPTGPPPPPPAAFAVTSVTFSTAASPIDLICPDDVLVTAQITTSAAGTVKYFWEDSTAAVSNLESLDFNAAGTKEVQYNVTVNAGGDHWAKLYIDDPNHQWFGPKNFLAICNP